MARYQGSVKGNRGEASRLGTPKSGIRAMARGWEGGARVFIAPDDDGDDHLTITVGPHEHVTRAVILQGKVKDIVKTARNVN